MKYSLSEIPAGEAGTDATVAQLKNMVHDAVRRPFIRLHSLDILKASGVNTRDHTAVARALYNWIHENIRYVNDPVNLETIQDPEATLEIAAGDCDDHSALMAALAMSVGIPARFHVSGGGRNHFQHIYAELQINGQWLPADTTETNNFGAHPMQLPENKVYNLDGGIMVSNVSGRSAQMQSVGMSGFVSDVWDDLRADIKDAFNKAVENIDIQFPDQLVTVNAPVGSDASRAAIKEFLSSPMVIGVGLLTIVVLAGASGRKRKAKAKAW